MAGAVEVMMLVECVEEVVVVSQKCACGRAFKFPPHDGCVKFPQEGCLLTDVKTVGYEVVV